MRIVFISHEAVMNGGAQACLFELIKGIKKLYPFWNIYVIFPSDGNMIRLFLPYISGYTIISQSTWIYLPQLQRRRSTFTLWKKYLRSAWHIVPYLRKIKPDCVVTNTIAIPSGAIAAKIMGCKHVWFIHEVPSETQHMAFVFKERFILFWVNRLSKQVVVTSDYSLHYYEKAGINLQKINRVYQAVELTGEVSHHIRSDRRYTLSLVGSFDPNKGQLELLEALTVVRQKGADLHCYLVGADSGEYTKQVKQYISLHALESMVTIVDYTSTPLDYFRLADVALVCSKSEAFGRVTIEAFKCGVPVIASDVGANVELVRDGYNGYLYKKGDKMDLADKIVKLADATLRKQLCDNFYPNIMTQYTRDKFASDFLKILLS